jgi:general secretion pathway protein F
MYCATVAAGEHTGRLDLVLSKLADYTESSHKSRQKVQLALIYPSVLLGLAVLVVTGLLTYIVPDVVKVFADQGQALPPLTQAMLDASDFLVNWGAWALVGIVIAVFAFRALLRNGDRREMADALTLKLPLAGRMSLAANSARFAGTLSTLVSSGVPLVDALERSGRFPPMMIYMIASGEQSGELERMLARVADSQQTELDNRIATMLGLLEPAVLLFMGVAVLCIVVAILQPIFSLNQMIT